MDTLKRGFVPIPTVKFPEIKIANLYAEETMYRDPRYDKLLGTNNTRGEDTSCFMCGKFPQTVCIECVEYVCENHIYRHSNCDLGR